MKRLIKKADKESYTIDELPDKIKRNVIDNTYDNLISIYTDDLNDEYKDNIHTRFPNSDLDFYYSINNGQGSGFGLNGDLDISDIYRITGIALNDEEEEIFTDLVDLVIYNLDGRTYFSEDMFDFSEGYNKDNVLDKLEDYYDQEFISVNDFCNKIKKMEEKLIEYVSDFCNNMYEYGKTYLTLDDDDIIEYLDDNDYKFDENGTIIV